MRAAAKEQGWDLTYGSIALLWRGGCIIRSAFLGKIKDAFDAAPDLANLLLDPAAEGRRPRPPTASEPLCTGRLAGPPRVPPGAEAGGERGNPTRLPLFGVQGTRKSFFRRGRASVNETWQAVQT